VCACVDGGGFSVTGGTVGFVGGSFTGDRAVAGAGGAGGAKGSGPGGSSGAAGAAGQGVGGAGYILGGSVTIGKKTTFADNFATTSDPDVFGPYVG
jgi:hypothetical protein